MAKSLKTEHSYFDVKRGIEVKKLTGIAKNCVRTKVTVAGKSSTFVLCAVGAPGSKPQLSISRTTPLFRGGKPNITGRQGGMTVCSAKGERSQCMRSSAGLILRVGGAGIYRRGGTQILNGYKRRK